MDMNSAIRNYVLLVLMFFAFKVTIGDSLIHDSRQGEQSLEVEQVEISE